jgi:hypothetical protein
LRQHRNPSADPAPQSVAIVCPCFGHAADVATSQPKSPNGSELALRAAVIVTALGVVPYSDNPFWRAETKGSGFLVFNAILNFDNLSVGKKLADK